MFGNLNTYTEQCSTRGKNNLQFFFNFVKFINGNMPKNQLAVLVKQHAIGL